MKRILIGAGLVLLLAASAKAAVISWGAAANYSSAGDVSTQGITVEAINACGTADLISPLVNGVQFSARTTLLNGNSSTKFFYGNTGDSNYNQLLNSLDYGSESTITVGGGQLESGKDYLIQIWFLDERGSYDGRAMQYGDGNGNFSAQLNDQYVIGTFTADGSSQTIAINGVGAGPHINAYQVRDLSSPVASLSSASGATVSGTFSMSVSFSESVTGLTAGDFVVVNGTAAGVNGSGTGWTVDIIPAGNGDVTVTLPADTVVDIDGHGNIASGTLLRTYVAPGSDQPVPTLSTASNSVYCDYTVQVDFSEPVTGLQLSDFSVSGGTVSSLSGAGANFSVVVSPNTGGDVVLSLPRNVVTDTDGDNLKNVASSDLTVAYYVSVSVSSPEGLLPYLVQDNISATLLPGTYTIDAAAVNATFGTPRFAFRGNNSTYDFSGVTINFAADVYTSGKSMNHIQIFGNNNVLKNLTMVDLCDKNGAKVEGGTNIIMDGRGNRVEGFHMTVRGSYPYGYGDSFGKGGTSTIKHWKHCALLVRGESNHVKNCRIIHRSYGHAIFMQAASNPTIEGCYVEGEMRSTDDMLAETSGPAYDIGFMTVWGFTLPAGFMKSTGEEGIRAYNAGTTYIDGVEYSRGTSNPTILDNTIVNMRAGVTLTHASGTKYVSGCKTIGCERGYAIGSGIIENCSGDVQYGPIFGVDYESDHGVTADIAILPYTGAHYNGSRHFAYILGSDHNLTFRGMETTADQSLEINVGGDKRIASSLYETNNYAASGIVINNLTGYPLVLDDAASGNTGQSIGPVTNNGIGNTFSMADWSVASNLAFYGKATQSSTAYDAIAGLARDQNTSGVWSQGSVTHTQSQNKPWWRIDLEGLHEISDIRIWGRTDAAVDRLSNFDVTVLDENSQVVWTAYQAAAPSPMISLSTGTVTGRYVKIQLRGFNPLSLAEVQIFGRRIVPVVEFDNSRDIGVPALAGSSTYSNGIYTVTGGGSDIQGTADSFHYLSTDHSGDGEIVTQVTSVQNSHSWAKAGPMFRESDASGSKNVFLAVRPDHQISMQYRAATGGSTSFWPPVGGAGVKWVKLIRSGDLFTGLYSADGESWTEIASVTVSMSPAVQRGFAVTAHNNAVLCTAVFNMVPPAPSGLNAVSVDADQVDLLWQAAAAATGYQLKRSTTAGGPYVPAAGTLSSTNFSDTGLSPGTRYYYVVSGEYDGVEGSPSAEVSAVPSALIVPDQVLVGPVEIRDSGAGGLDFSVSVTNSVPGHNYRVLRAEDLANPVWVDAAGVFPGNGELLRIDVPLNSTATNGFYKLETWRQ